jgi:hypothetical protein
VSLLTRRITLVALVASLAGGMLALPASAKPGPVASASKCKKAKKGKHKKKKKKRCGTSPTAATLPGQATHPTTTAPVVPPAPRVNSLGLTDNPVLAGRSTQAQVTVAAPAPAGGQPVDLESSNPARVSVPASVYVAPGQTTANFAVSTTAGVPISAIVTASIATSVASAQLDVVSTPSVSSVALDHNCYPGTGPFGANRVTLDVAAPADTPVNLASDDELALTVPSQVTVPSGSKTAFFGVTAVAPTPSVTVTATLSPSQASDSASVRSPASPAPAAESLDLSPSSITSGGSSTGTVTLDCEALAGGSVVNLSSDSADITLPTTVTVPADSLTVTFPITTAGTTAGGTHTITATAGGTEQEATLTVNNLPT